MMICLEFPSYLGYDLVRTRFCRTISVLPFLRKIDRLVVQNIFGPNCICEQSTKAERLTRATKTPAQSSRPETSGTTRDFIVHAHAFSHHKHDRSGILPYWVMT